MSSNVLPFRLLHVMISLRYHFYALYILPCYFFISNCIIVRTLYCQTIHDVKSSLTFLMPLARQSVYHRHWGSSCVFSKSFSILYEICIHGTHLGSNYMYMYILTNQYNYDSQI